MLFVFFFFQAEDGIRDKLVTGVQTCALPICLLERYTQPAESQLPTVSHTGEIPSGQPTTTIWIDGKEVTAIPGEAILRAAQRAGFNIPTLCDDEKLAPAAACRMCLVNIEGQ